MKFIIFGKIFSFNINEDMNESAKKSLFTQLNYYPTADPCSDADVTVRIKRKLKPHVLSKIGENHEEIENGFVIHYLKWSVAYRKEKEKVYCEVELKEENNPLLYHLKKMNNIEFLSVYERSRQIINENVLLPAVYFFDDRAILHCSTVADKNRSALMIGGRGGVGKTSLSLKLCRNHDYYFVADDMSVIDSKANIYPNLAFPKIYAYNIQNDPKLQSLIKSNLSSIKRVLWQCKKYILGADKVRISLPPDLLYGNYYVEIVKATDYYMLFPKSGEINCEKLDKEEAVKESLDVMDREYNEFHRHILKHEQYCKENDKKPIITKKEVFGRWEETLRKALSEVKCSRVDMPPQMPHWDKLGKLTELIG